MYTTQINLEKQTVKFVTAKYLTFHVVWMHILLDVWFRIMPKITYNLIFVN